MFDEDLHELMSFVIQHLTTTPYQKRLRKYKFFGLDTAYKIDVTRDINVEDGHGNLIKWKATDSMGNGPGVSGSYRILVDTQELEFSNIFPKEKDVSSRLTTMVGITIKDQTSGVNASTIEYSISKDNGQTWGSWTSTSGYENGNTIDVRMNLTFPNGTRNWIKWRAEDIAGNQVVVSEPNPVNVNTLLESQKYITMLISPANGALIEKKDVIFTWLLTDSGGTEDVLYKIYLDKVNPPEEMIDEEYWDTKITLKDLEDGVTYYWTVIATTGEIDGICMSGVWSFTVNIESYGINISGPTKIVLSKGEDRSVQIIVLNQGTKNDVVVFAVDTGDLPSSYILFKTSSEAIPSLMVIKKDLTIALPETAVPGTYRIKITAVSTTGEGNIKDDHVITLRIISEKGGGDSNKEGVGNNNLMYGIIPVVIAVICIILVFLMYQRKKKGEGLSIGPLRVFVTKPDAIKKPTIDLQETGQVQQPVQPEPVQGIYHGQPHQFPPQIETPIAPDQVPQQQIGQFGQAQILDGRRKQF